MSSNQLFDVLITFKSASNVPVGDLIARSSNPFLIVLLTPRTPPSPEHPPFPLRYRTSTKRSTRNPEWNETWHLGGIPVEGFDLEIKVKNEDRPGDFDDRLGVAEFSITKLPSATENGEAGEEAEENVLKIKKRKASRRAYAATYIVAWCNGDFKKQRGRVNIFRMIELTAGYYFNSKSWKVDMYKELSLRFRSDEMEYSHIISDRNSHSILYSNIRDV